MKEDFLYYIWQFCKFDSKALRTVNNESIEIIKVGERTLLSGPDFFNAQIVINNQKWAGNIEIHVKSSDWYLHHHEINKEYDSVILHVVWEYDEAVFRKDNTEVPVLELKNIVSKKLLNQYEIFKNKDKWIYCENEIASVPNFVFKNWIERLYFERLEKKSEPIENFLIGTKNDWETTLFCFLAKNFGLNINGNSFYDIATSIPFSVIRKESYEVENLEALFFGKANLLNDNNNNDEYFRELNKRWFFLKNKYSLTTNYIGMLEFYKHHPVNFPTIRLSQLANLYHTNCYLFSKIIVSKSINEMYEILNISVSKYWQTHYNFNKKSPKKNKFLSKSFKDLLIINTILPVKFIYEKNNVNDIIEDNLFFLEQFKAEKNSIISRFQNIGIIARNAFESQSLIHLKNEYCNKSRCLECEIGLSILKN